MPERYFWSYTLIPLSSIMFPAHGDHVFRGSKSNCVLNERSFFYPLADHGDLAPCIFLGVLGTQLEPGLKNPDGVLLHLLTHHAARLGSPEFWAPESSRLLWARIHTRCLAISTMVSLKNVFGHYGGKGKYGEKGSVFFARGFILVVTGIAYLIALKTPETIFELAVRFAFSGFAAMSPVMIAALFWRRSHEIWGARLNIYG
jgi:Na+/pantothenate symporter